MSKYKTEFYKKFRICTSVSQLIKNQPISGDKRRWRGKKTLTGPCFCKEKK